MAGLVEALDLTSEERDVIGRALRAIVDGPYIDDWEFPIVMGLERDECRIFLKAWPELPPDKESFVFVKNSLNNYFGPFHLQDHEMLRLVGVDNHGLADLLTQLRRRAIAARLIEDHAVP